MRAQQRELPVHLALQCRRRLPLMLALMWLAKWTHEKGERTWHLPAAPAASCASKLFLLMRREPPRQQEQQQQGWHHNAEAVAATAPADLLWDAGCDHLGTH